MGAHRFILCLGYRAETVKQYFLDYDETRRERLRALANGVQLLGADTEGWRITFLDTGVHAEIGDRLRPRGEHLGDDDLFLATYGDGLTDAPLDEMIEHARSQREEGTVHVGSPAPELPRRRDRRRRGRALDRADGDRGRPHQRRFLRASAGRSSSDLQPGEDIMERRRTDGERGELIVYRYDGFWAPMDTIKDKQDLDAIVESGNVPWHRPRARPVAG